MEDRSLCPLYG